MSKKKAFWLLLVLPAACAGVGIALLERSLSLALAAQLAIQTAGTLWLYIPALRRRQDGPGV